MVGAVLYLVACGSIIRKGEPLRACRVFSAGKRGVSLFPSLTLCLIILSFHMSHAVAFDAPHLQPATVAEPLANLTKLNAILSSGFVEALGCAIGESAHLGMQFSRYA